MTSKSGTPESSERRGDSEPIPPNLDDYLTKDQRMALDRIEGFGWRPAFLRRPLFETPTAVVAGPEQQGYTVLETDGELNREPDIVIRH